MLAINQISFNNIPITTPEDLIELRGSGKLPFDQMPLLEINGMNLSQSSGMIRYLARIGGFYGDNDKEALYCDMFAGAITDFAEASMQAAFQPSNEIAVKMLEERFNKFAPKFELRIKENGSEFCVGKKISFADIILTEALSSYVEWIPDLLKNTPLLLSIYEKVINQTGIKLYLSSELRYPKPSEKYVIDVARVLQRALPAHMSDINRFVN
jgi:glutathione S-transferase